jgi:hypothetical protein
LSPWPYDLRLSRTELSNSPTLTSQEAQQLLDITHSADWIKLIGIVIMKGREPLLDHDELKSYNPYFINLALIDAIKDRRYALIKSLIECGKAVEKLILTFRIQ